MDDGAQHFAQSSIDDASHAAQTAMANSFVLLRRRFMDVPSHIDVMHLRRLKMNKYVYASALLAFFTMPSAFSADKSIRDPELEFKKGASFSAMAPVTEEEVGDVDSFKRNVKWAGLGQTKSVVVDSACIPNDHTVCAVPSSGGAFASFDARDLETIVLPGKTAKSLVCHHITPFYTYNLSNATGTLTNNARISLAPYVTIYNDALNDPSAIDPSTGLPYAGQLESGMAMTTLHTFSMVDGGSETHRENYSRHCIAGLISKNGLINTWGLSASLAEQFFKHDTKIVFHLRGNHNFVDNGTFFYGIRFTVD